MLPSHSSNSCRTQRRPAAHRKRIRPQCPRLPSASHTVSRRSHFGSATDPGASLWSGGIDRRTPTHPLGNSDEFQGVSPLFQRPELLSARATILLDNSFSSLSLSGIPFESFHSLRPFACPPCTTEAAAL